MIFSFIVAMIVIPVITHGLIKSVPWAILVASTCCGILGMAARYYFTGAVN